MSQPLDLAELTDQPQTVSIPGCGDYQFSELPIASLGRLQAWIKANVPHPLDALKGHLDGFDAESKAILLKQAREDAQTWPPVVGTPDAARILFGQPAGQKALILEALRLHQPDATEAQAEAIRKALQRDAALSLRLVAIWFGLATEHLGDLAGNVR